MGHAVYGRRRAYGRRVRAAQPRMQAGKGLRTNAYVCSLPRPQYCCAPAPFSRLSTGSGGQVRQCAKGGEA